MAQESDREEWGSACRDHDLISAHEDGMPLQPERVTMVFAELVRRAGVRPVRVLRDLRHGAPAAPDRRGRSWPPSYESLLVRLSLDQRFVGFRQSRELFFNGKGSKMGWLGSTVATRRTASRARSGVHAVVAPEGCASASPPAEAAGQPRARRSRSSHRRADSHRA